MSSPKSSASLAELHVLIDKWLQVVDGAPHKDAAAIIGMDPTSVANWRNGKLPKAFIDDATRDRIEAHLRRVLGKSGETVAVDALTEIEHLARVAQHALRQSLTKPAVVPSKEVQDAGRDALKKRRRKRPPKDGDAGAAEG